MKPSFEGFTNKKSCGSGKTNLGNAAPENVDAGFKFSSSKYINETGTSTKVKWYYTTIPSVTSDSSGLITLSFPFQPKKIIISCYTSNYAFCYTISNLADFYTAGVNGGTKYNTLRSSGYSVISGSNSTFNGNAVTISTGFSNQVYSNLLIWAFA